MAFSATYDACVLHPAGLRDLLVRLGMTGLFRAVWSDQILDEMVGSIGSRCGDRTASRRPHQPADVGRRSTWPSRKLRPPALRCCATATLTSTPQRLGRGQGPLIDQIVNGLAG